MTVFGSPQNAAQCGMRMLSVFPAAQAQRRRVVDKTVENLSINGDNNSQNAETEAFPDVDNFAVLAGRL